MIKAFEISTHIRGQVSSSKWLDQKQMTIGRYIIKSNLGRYNVIIYEECAGRVGYNEILLSIGVANTTAVL